MNDTVSVSLKIGNHTLSLSTGLMARQAAGSATVQLGETIMFSAVTCTASPREGIDYFPLQVEYREKFYAAGRFPGGFFKREARPSEKEILSARLTDRPIRPLFPEGYRNDVQINNMLLSADGENDPDILSIVAASTALHLSDIPFMGPIGAVRIGRIAGELIVNPTHDQREQSDLDLIYTGTRDQFLMIEGAADEIDEADLLNAMRQAQAQVTLIVDAQIELRRKAGLPEKVVTELPADTALMDRAREWVGDEFAEIMCIPGKLERQQRIRELGDTLKAKLLESDPDMTDEAFRALFDALEIDVVRRNALEKGRRVDGRAFDEMRPLSAQIGLLPRTHGSALFNRGETQALGTVTLGAKSDLQSLDAVTGGETQKSFMLHYNFPPYSVGEVGRLGMTGRREIGHGALAERSLKPVIPGDYPYTIRLVSDIMGSNGSSSMASICVGTLAMMDAGIPIQSPVAGISIGLFSSPDGQRNELVTDILGVEDHCGDMDFKVAGTRKGITGFQVDLKLRGLAWEQVEGALTAARTARLKLLDFMATVIESPRTELSRHAPRIVKMEIPVDKIGELIGPGGKNIRRIVEISGAQIDIEEDGTVNLYASTAESLEIAEREVALITAEVEEGKIYEGTVTGIKEFGAFVEILPGRDGLVHISEMANERIRSVEDICKLGDRMKVKCIGVDDRGRVKLSRRAAMAELDQQHNED